MNRPNGLSSSGWDENRDVVHGHAWGHDPPTQILWKNRKFGEKMDGNEEKIWFDKLGENPFWVLVYLHFTYWR